MRKPLAIAAAVLAASVHTATAQSPIDVSHGVRLGETFDPSAAIDVRQASYGDKMLYEIDPGERARDLGKVYVAITPDDNRVYEIWAIKHFRNGTPCRDLRDEMFDTLKARYPEARPKRAMMSPDGRRSVIKGDTKISTACKTGISKATFYLRHRHTALHNQVAER